MSKVDLDRFIEEYDHGEEPILRMDGYDDCVAGICIRFGQQAILIYDQAKVIEKLVGSGMSYEEAVEFWEYNQVGAWCGNGTPAFLVRIDEMPA